MGLVEFRHTNKRASPLPSPLLLPFSLLFVRGRGKSLPRRSSWRGLGRFTALLPLFPISSRLSAHQGRLDGWAKNENYQYPKRLSKSGGWSPSSPFKLCRGFLSIRSGPNWNSFRAASGSRGNFTMCNCRGFPATASESPSLGGGTIPTSPTATPPSPSRTCLRRGLRRENYSKSRIQIFPR